jgi:HD-GYP domain-containing protein (c-di-GMP phosphodiesterase class II)
VRQFSSWDISLIPCFQTNGYRLRDSLVMVARRYVGNNAQRIGDANMQDVRHEMIATTLRRRIGWSAVIFLPIVIQLALIKGVFPDLLFGAPRSHVYVVATTAVLLGLLATLMAYTALQVRDTRVFFLALTFLSISGLFLAHALTTPGIIVPYQNPWVGFSAYFSLAVGSLWLALSTWDWPQRIATRIIAQQHCIFALVVSILLAYNALAVVTSLISTAATSWLAAPDAALPHLAHLPGVIPVATNGLLGVMGNPLVPQLCAAGAVGLYCTAIWRHLRRYRLAPSALVAGLLIASVFLIQAQIIQVTTIIWHASWWEYHVLILGAFFAAAIALSCEYARSGSLAGVVAGLLLRDTMQQLEHGYTEVIVALVAAVEAKDPYTRGHTQRVAELAIRIGEELRLSPERLRTLGRAAMLHDIGKIGVPDAILNKPGKLTKEEFAAIQEHPIRGYQMISGIRSLRRELNGVRSHHERLDGSGYPDGLRGAAIPQEARIIAVADVYDALTSRRAYREALSVSAALAIIAADAGLDARCVAALPAALTRVAAPMSDRPFDISTIAHSATPQPMAAD